MSSVLGDWRRRVESTLAAAAAGRAAVTTAARRGSRRAAGEVPACEWRRALKFGRAVCFDATAATLAVGAKSGLRPA
jgi:hypothetical protein